MRMSRETEVVIETPQASNETASFVLFRGQAVRYTVVCVCVCVCVCVVVDSTSVYCAFNSWLIFVHILDTPCVSTFHRYSVNTNIGLYILSSSFSHVSTGTR